VGGGTYVAPSKPEPNDNQMLSRGLAQTNPNRPDIDLPLFIFELRDIPEMIREWGFAILRTKNRWTMPNGSDPLRDVPAAAGSRYLEYKFGIEPVYNDLLKMLDFQSKVDKRIRSLRNLSEGVSTRHATVYSDTAEETSWSSALLTGLYQETSRVRWRMRTDRRYWVSTRWVTDMPLPESDAELKSLAYRLVFGVHGLSLDTLWNSLPWSWMIDWFSNVGDIVASTRNHVPVNHFGSCIMKHTRKAFAAWEWVNEPSGGKQTLQPIDSLGETKSRYAAPLFVYPEFYLPLLTGGQLSILSALAITRKSVSELN
jgi:hypothetical protein